MQSPQLLVVVMSVSQPLSGLASQLLKPVEQVGEQSEFGAVPVHTFCVTCALVVWHRLPQLAQLACVPSWVSQPGKEVLQSA